MTSTFDVYIGTMGRQTLANALDSIAGQGLLVGDRVLVGIDARNMEQDEVNRIASVVRRRGEGFIAEPHVGIAMSEKTIPDGGPGGPAGVVRPGDPYSWLGVEQINHMWRRHSAASATHVMTIGDDDAFVDGAYQVLREACAKHPRQPVIFRFKAPNGWILWDRPRLKPCYISGCCIAAPAEFAGPHPTDIETTHDYRWIMDVVEKARSAGLSPVWLDYVGVVARPGPYDAKGIWTCPNNCDFTAAWGRVAEGKNTRCHRCGVDMWEDVVLSPRVVEGAAE